MIRNSVSALATLGAATVLSAAPATAAPPPRATVVPCGAVLTTSVRLAADVVCPDGRGLTLAADGVELNLNGHTVSGPGLKDGSIGVDVRAQDAVVRNGRITGWGAGVSAGIEVDSSEERLDRSATVRQVRLDSNRIGADARVGGDLTVRASRLDRNSTGGAAYVSGALLVEGSTVERNERGLSGFANVDGEFVVRDSLVRSNTYGLMCNQDADITVERTTVQRNGTGLDMNQCSGVVTGSRFQWNGEHLVTYLLEQDVLTISCTSFSRDGGPVTVPVGPC